MKPGAFCPAKGQIAEFFIFIRGITAFELTMQPAAGNPAGKMAPVIRRQGGKIFHGGRGLTGQHPDPEGNPGRP